EALQLRQAILHAQHRLRVIHVDAGFEGEFGDGRGIDVDHVPFRVVGEEMAAADLAPLPEAALRLVEDGYGIFSLGDLDCLRLPEREGVDGAGGPASAGCAVAVAHSHGRSFDRDLDGATEALPV